MSPSRALGKIGHLASRRLQQRYIVEATVDEYLVVDQLLEDAYSFLSDPFVPSELNIELFRAALRSVAIDESETPTYTVNANPTWANLRTEAQRILLAMGADLRSFEDDNLS